MSEKNNFLYDVSMSYVNAGWQERYCALVKYLDAYLKENCGEFFADLQLYQTGPMNYVVVAVYYDVPGVGEDKRQTPCKEETRVGERGAGESGRTTIPSQQQMQELVIIIME